MSRPRVVRDGAVTIRISDDPAVDIARSLGVRLRSAIRRRGEAALAVSGGSAAPSMLSAFVHEDLDWGRVTVWQVDERIVADDHRDRNARQLSAVPALLRPMPVTDHDVEGAASRYASQLPTLDAVHLGLGGDGHTASWPPAPHPDAAVVDCERRVAVVGAFNGHGRMTMTPVPINAARSRLFLVAGAEKADVVRRWLDLDPRLPACHVRRSATTLFLDPDAAGRIG
ncbi:MAG: 6-phosphogluconolactonase [Ilumatobacter sp.]|nr:6-phosphogluconolactonase [Ilumatobacter sp.]